MPSRLDEAINMLNSGEEQPVKSVKIHLRLTNESPLANIRLFDTVGEDRSNSSMHEFQCELGHDNDWARLGSAFGCNTNVTKLRLSRSGNDNNINMDVYQCIESFYRGIRSNTSIRVIHLGVDLFPGTLPILNLHDAQFRHSLEWLVLQGGTMSNNLTTTVTSLLENTALQCFEMVCERFESNDDESFRGIILACTGVNYLVVYCASRSRCASVGILLGNPTSIVSDMRIIFRRNTGEDEGHLSEIARGLVGNITLKVLRIEAYFGDMSPIAEALCNASSIENIQASNHTLTYLSTVFSSKIPSLIRDYLSLNKQTNKEVVIRTKIARYFFKGDFDLSRFANMDMKCLPRVLAMIGGGETNDKSVILREDDAINQQSAIFRLLKSIPGLCNVSSRDLGQSNRNENGVSARASDSTANKRQKVRK